MMNKISLQIKNGNVSKIEIPENLKIGDEVYYSPKEQEYLWQAKYSGATSDVKIKNTDEQYSITKWKILNINDDGTIDLIADKPTVGTVTLGYAQGYNNGVKLLNDACNALYGDEELGIVARSINIEDIEDKMNDETLESIKDSGTNSPVQCGEQIPNAYSAENSKYPSIYAMEEGSVINNNKNENGIKASEQDSFIEKDANGGINGGITNAESIQPSQSYYYRDQNAVLTFFKGDGTGTDNLIYNLLMPDGIRTNYWVASRGIHVSDNICNFGIRMVFWGMNMGQIATSSNLNNSVGNEKIFPIVTINFNMLVKNDSNQWIIKQGDYKPMMSDIKYR